MLKIVYIVLLGVILSSCASNYKDFDTYKGDMPFVEGTPTQELLEELPDLDQQKITIAYKFTDQTGQRESLVQNFLNYLRQLLKDLMRL